MNIIRYKNNSLLEYVKRFRQACDVVKSQVGEKFLDAFVTNQEEYRTYRIPNYERR